MWKEQLHVQDINQGNSILSLFYQGWQFMLHCFTRGGNLCPIVLSRVIDCLWFILIIIGLVSSYFWKDTAYVLQEMLVIYHFFSDGCGLKSFEACLISIHITGVVRIKIIKKTVLIFLFKAYQVLHNYTCKTYKMTLNARAYKITNKQYLDSLLTTENKTLRWQRQ